LEPSSGLPDAIFSCQKSHFRNILDGLGMEVLVYFIVICNTLWQWYNYSLVIWYTFSRFGMFYQEKSGNPDHVTKESNISLMKVKVLG
jgi:hypothetical protein